MHGPINLKSIVIPSIQNQTCCHINLSHTRHVSADNCGHIQATLQRYKMQTEVETCP